MLGRGLISRGLAVAASGVAVAIVVGVGGAWAQDEEGPMSNIHILVVRDANSKPIRNAAVVLHPVTRKGKQAMGGMELKTDDDGKTGIDGIPYGPLRVQVLADGFQTFGEDYQINKADMEITVKLKRPVRQVSAYGVQDKKPDSSGQKSGDPKAAEQKPQ